MPRLCILSILLVASLAPLPIAAKGKKGKLNETISVTRTERVELNVPGNTDTDVDGLTVSVTVDHEAIVLVHGVLGFGQRNYGFVQVGISVDEQDDPEPLQYLTNDDTPNVLPLLRSVTLQPGTHSIRVRMRQSVALQGVLFDRRFVVLVF